MPLVVKDRVRETTTTTGTGTITLAGAVAGFQSFSAIGDANTTYYTINLPGANEWEVGLGTYTASGTTLSRDTILASSNSGSAVNFSAGTKDVFCTYPAGRSVYYDTSTNVTLNALTLSGGTANGVLYLDGSKVATTGSALTYNANGLGIGVAAASRLLDIQNDQNAPSQARIRNDNNGTASQSSWSVSYGDFAQYLSMAQYSPSFTTSGLRIASSAGLFTAGNSNGLRIYTIDAAPVIFGVSDSEKMRLGSAVGGVGALGIGYSTLTSVGDSGLAVLGNVGIGTNAPTQKLTVNSGSATTTAQFTSTGSSVFLGLTNSGASAFIGADSAGSFIVQTPGSSYSTKLTVDISGNLLIGTSTNTNSSTIVANGTISETVSSTQYLVASQFDVGTNPNQIPLNQYLGDMAFQSSAGVSIGMLSVSGNATFSNGNLLVGTTSDISGNGAYGVFGNSSAAGANRWAAYFGANSASSNPAPNFGLAIGWNKSGGGGEANIVYGISLGGAPGLAFSSSDGTTVTERARIDSSGNLMLGGTSTTQLDGVFGQIIGSSAKTTAGIALETSAGAYMMYTDSSDALIFWDSGSNVERARITNGGGFVTKPAAGSESVFNEDGVDADFRVESDTSTHMFFVDASDNSVNINTSTTLGGKLNVNGAIVTDSNHKVHYPLPSFLFGAGGVTDEYWVVARRYVGGLAAASGLSGQIIGSRGSSGTGNIISIQNVNLLSAYNVNSLVGLDSLGNEANFVAVDIISISGVEYYALRARPSGGDCDNGLFFHGFMVNNTGDTNVFSRVRASTAGVSVVTTNVGILNSWFSGDTYLEANRAGFNRILINGTETAINESGADYDFRVESDANTHALFVDAGNSYVGINQSAPRVALDFIGLGFYQNPPSANYTLKRSVTEVNQGSTATTTYQLIARIDFGVSWSPGTFPVITLSRTYRDGVTNYVRYALTAEDNLQIIDNFNGSDVLRIKGPVTYNSNTGVYELWVVSPAYSAFSIAFEGYWFSDTIPSSPNGQSVEVLTPVASAATTTTSAPAGLTQAAYFYQSISPASEFVLNEYGADLDFRVESDTSTHMFFVDAGANLVNINDANNFNAARLFVNGNINAGYSDTIAMRYNVSGQGNSYYKGMSGTNPSGSTARGLHIFNFDQDSDQGINFWSGVPGGTVYPIAYFGPGATGAVVFNDDGLDRDFRVESDTSTHMFFVDAGSNAVGINSSNPVSSSLTVEHIDSPLLVLRNTGNSDTYVGVNGLGAGLDSFYIAQYAGIAANEYDFRIVGGTREFTFARGGVVNEGGADSDFRVESDTNTHMLFVDAGANAVLINQTSNTNGGALSVNGTFSVCDSATGLQSSMSKIGTKQTSSISTSATTIFTDVTQGMSSASAGQFLIFGDDNSGNGFMDVVAARSSGTVAVVSSSTLRGSPAARTYTMSTAALQLAMASGTYSTMVRCETLGFPF